MNTKIIPFLLLTSLSFGQDTQPPLSLIKGTNKITVKLGAETFTEYLYGPDRTKPILFPIYAPGGARMVRNFPIIENPADQPTEANDHPHHESLWFTHGDVNGISFWHIDEGKTGTIVHRELVSTEDDTITTRNDWKGPYGKIQCTDTTSIHFAVLAGGARAIDYTITIHADHGDVKFGDTKEGSMGIRSHPNLRLTGGKEVTTANGKAINSNGEKDGAIWGKAAAWVDYWGDIDGKTVGFAIMDHPSNPRHPTTWHARDYGLVAANPFGLSDFQKKPKGSGDMLIKNGETVTFKYRFLFHEGDVKKATIAEAYKTWSSAK
jgi:hypothetical protein